MSKTITVTGIGQIEAKPDLVVLSIEMETCDVQYETAMNAAKHRIQHATETLTKLGFDKEDLKTVDFDVATQYDNEKDENGNYHRRFNGYKVSHDLKLAFDFDKDKLSTVLSVISRCLSKMEFSIRFTVKDKTAVNEAVLRSASINAKRKAEILCEASGVQLGELLSVNYSWREINIYSDTRYKLPVGAFAEYSIEPDDIEASDTVTFVWEIH